MGAGVRKDLKRGFMVKSLRRLKPMESLKRATIFELGFERERQRSEARVLNCTMVIDCRRLHVNMGKFLNVNSLQFDKEMTCVYVQMERKDSRREVTGEREWLKKVS